MIEGKGGREWWIYQASLVLVLVAVGWSVSGLAGLPARWQHWNEREAQIAQLRALESENQLFDELRPALPVTGVGLDGLEQGLGEGLEPMVTTRILQNSEGLQLKEGEFRFDAVAFGDVLGRLLVEDLYPLRWVGMTLVSEGQPGHGSLTARFLWPEVQE